MKIEKKENWRGGNTGTRVDDHLHGIITQEQRSNFDTTWRRRYLKWGELLGVDIVHYKLDFIDDSKRVNIKIDYFL